MKALITGCTNTHMSNNITSVLLLNDLITEHQQPFSSQQYKVGYAVNPNHPPQLENSWVRLLLQPS